jgi:hypothetical protein
MEPDYRRASLDNRQGHPDLSCTNDPCVAAFYRTAAASLTLFLVDRPTCLQDALRCLLYLCPPPRDLLPSVSNRQHESSGPGIATELADVPFMGSVFVRHQQGLADRDGLLGAGA